MKVYRFEIRVTGYTDVEVKAETEQEARDRLADRFDTIQPISNLSCRSLDLNLLDIDGVEQ